MKKKIFKRICSLSAAIILITSGNFNVFAAENTQFLIDGLEKNGSIESFDFSVLNSTEVVEIDHYTGNVRFVKDGQAGCNEIIPLSEFPVCSENLSDMSLDELIQEYISIRKEYYDSNIAKGALDCSDSTYKDLTTFSFLDDYHTVTYTSLEDYYQRKWELNNFHLADNGEYVYTDTDGNETAFTDYNQLDSKKEYFKTHDVLTEEEYGGSTGGYFPLNFHNNGKFGGHLGSVEYQLFPKRLVRNDIIYYQVEDGDTFNTDDYFIQFEISDVDENKTHFIYDGEWKSFLIVEGKVSDTYVYGKRNIVLAFFQPAISPLDYCYISAVEYESNQGYEEERYNPNVNLATGFLIFEVFPNPRMEAPAPVKIETTKEPMDMITINEEPTPNIDFQHAVVILPFIALFLLVLFKRRTIKIKGALLDTADTLFKIVKVHEGTDKTETVQDIINRLVIENRLDYDTLDKEIIASGYVTKIPVYTKMYLYMNDTIQEMKVSQKKLDIFLAECANNHVKAKVRFHERKTDLDVVIEYPFT